MKIIVSDYDGTLFYNDTISQKDREAIKRFRNSGGKFGIVTSRDLHASKWIIQNIDIDFLICSTGAIVCDGSAKILCRIKSTRTDILDDVIKEAVKLDLDSFTISDELIRLHVDISGEMKPDFNKIYEFSNATAWFKSEQGASLLNDYIIKNHKNEISAFKGERVIELAPQAVSKSTGILNYAKFFNEPEIYTVGDIPTDVPMVRDFIGFSVSNSCIEVKNVAKHHADRVCDMIDYILDEK